MIDDEKALQAARDVVPAEAFKAAGLRVAAAEFRAVAVGKLADPARRARDVGPVMASRYDYLGLLN